ncbi:hypothetical protein ABPG72_010512 [Tetrahymena utriculariae]
MSQTYLLFDRYTQKKFLNDQSNQPDSEYIYEKDYDLSTSLSKKKIKQENSPCLLKKTVFQYQESKEALNYNFGKKTKNSYYKCVNNQDNQKRQDNSLSILTRRFMKQIRSESDQTIDLNQVSVVLGVQKRRIYDITNVLEGINYVKKVSKNKLKWIGPPNQERSDNIIIDEVQQLITEDIILDKVIGEFNEKIKNLLEQQDKYCYLNSQDIKQLGKKQKQNEKTIIIQLPKKSLIQIKDYSKEQKERNLNMEISKGNQKYESIKRICITSSLGNFQKSNTQSTDSTNPGEQKQIKVYKISQIQLDQ